MGTLNGYVNIGPLCPVEPCNFSEEQLKNAHSNYRVVLYDSKMKEIKKLSIDGKGLFKTNLKPGTYYLEVKPIAGQSLDTTPPAKVTISKGKVSNIKMAHDTGLR